MNIPKIPIPLWMRRSYAFQTTKINGVYRFMDANAHFDWRQAVKREWTQRNLSVNGKEISGSFFAFRTTLHAPVQIVEEEGQFYTTPCEVERSHPFQNHNYPYKIVVPKQRVFPKFDS